MPVKKHIKPGRIEPSSDGTAIVVHFTTVITHLDDDGSPGDVEKSPDKREIPVGKAIRGLELEDLPGLAQEIVEQCKYIPATKTHQVEQVLEKLYAVQLPGNPLRQGQPRDSSPDAEDLSTSVSPRLHPSASSSEAASPQVTQSSPRRHKGGQGDLRHKDRVRSERPCKDRGDRRHETDRRAGSHRPQEERRNSEESEDRGRRPRMNSMEGAGDRRGRHRARGRPVDFLPDASIHNVDDYADELYEESMDLKAQGALRLLRLCAEPWQLGAVADHPTLLGVLSRELRESAKRSHELAVAITGIFLCLARFTHFHEHLAQHQVAEASLRVLEYQTKRRAVLQKELRHAHAQLAEKGENATAEDQQNLKREEKRYRGVMERQDRLTLICALMLRDLCQETKVEAKLAAQHLCKLIAPLLARPGEDLVLTALGFLQKLSVFVPNKDVLIQSSDVLAHLADLAGHQNVDIAVVALRLCYNLSFDQHGREKLASQTSLLGRLPAAAQQPGTQKFALKLLYRLSNDTQLRASLASRNPSCIILALQMAARGKGHQAEQEAVALCVNFAADEACAALMMEERDTFPKVVLRAISVGDPLALKIVRNVAKQPASRPKLLATMGEAPHGDPQWLMRLFRLAEKCRDRPDVLVETLGTFAGLDCASPEVPWPELGAAGLLDLLHRHLIVGFAEDDVLLEAVQIAGILALDPGSVAMLAGSKVPQDIPALLLEKSQDADLVVQLLFTLRCLLLQDECCDAVLHGPAGAARAVMDALRAGRHKMQPAAQQAVQAAADEVLELIIAREEEDGGDRQWSQRIKEFRYELHNEEWCQRMRKAPDAKASSAVKTTQNGASAGQGHSWAGATSLADRVWDLSFDAALT